MLLNNLRYAVYTLRQHPSYAVLNIVGLSLALACSLLLFWLIRFHWSFDTYHKKVDRTYRVVTDFGPTQAFDHSPGAPTPMGPALRAELPFIETAAMSIGQQNRIIRVLDPAGKTLAKHREAQAVAFVEPMYFDILDYRWLHSTAHQALRQPFTAVLTRRLARKYFGSRNPIGRCLSMNNALELTVTGLVDDIPDNTDQPYELFISYATLDYFVHNGTPLKRWEGVNWRTHAWVLLPPGGNPKQLNKALAPLRIRHYGPDFDDYAFHAIPVWQLHTSEKYYGQIAERNLRVLTWIGALLILTACVNFINIATTQAFRRGKEIGVRRVIGATRKRIFWQFITETAVLTILSGWLGLILAYTVLPFLREWTNTPIPVGLDLTGWGFLLGLILVVTLLAGTYPGLILTGFRPARVLKGQPTTQTVGGLSLRRGLVVGQLAISMAFVIAVLIMLRQLTAWLTADVGFEANRQIFIPIPRPQETDLASLRTRLQQIPGVESVSFCSDSPASEETNLFRCFFDNRPAPEPWYIICKMGDAQFVPTFGLTLVAGRNLVDSDTINGYLINETAVRALGVKSPQAVVGKTLTLEFISKTPKPIVGVLRDWQHRSSKENRQPIVLFNQRKSYGSCGIRVDPDKRETALAAVQEVWNQQFPNDLFLADALTERLAQFYEGELREVRPLRLAAIVAILIGCVGLYGLIAFMTSRRAREIAVRKSLGARVDQIVWLFVREFLVLLLLAFGLAAPLSGWLMQVWLSRYESHISLAPGAFLTGLFVVTTITLLTISYQAIRAALTNPAHSLRAD
ncbi:FtsX-like permease family protein [Spirosoma soli]|uniref:FtsX-like permease family protein n=1 Tax=Spirosoma soli TaxID=1770529 RepID=A0ABW5MC80_9BACT